MYNYIFWVIYNRNINRNKSEWLSRHNASGVVFFAILVHLFFLIEISMKLFHANFGLKYLAANKGISIIGVLLCIFFVYLHYTQKRINGINNQYAKSNRIATWNNGMIVVILIFIPLISIIVIGWKR